MQKTGCERNCKICLGKLCTHKIPIFSTLAYAELENIARHIVHKDYEKGGQIVSEGETPEFVVILSRGTAKAYTYTPDGREQILYIFSEGDFFGEQHLLRRQAATYSVEALETTSTCLLYRRDFETLLAQYPSIALKVIEELGGRMARLESAVQSMGVRSLDARVSDILLEFAAKYGKDTPEGVLVRLPLSREGIANYLGIARETVSRKLSGLESEGVIRSVNNKALLICDQKALNHSAGL